MTDLEYMNRALELAERGRGSVEPNPLVGAVIVRENQIVGEGWHEKFGQPHAEINALRQAGNLAQGATLYVTLEPCCHFGKTPPCTDAVIASGIHRVIAAMLDPFPPVSGKGIALLQAAGIIVEHGIGEPVARQLNAPYLKLLRANTPYIHAKWAMTLDGKIATSHKDSKWITGETSRSRVHQLRGRMDAILVGRGTLLADDPLLTARPPGPRIPARIVLTSGHQPIPESLQLFQTLDQAPVMIVTPENSIHRFEHLKQKGCEILSLPLREDEQVSIDGLLKELGRRRMTNVLVEGGSGVLGAFLDAKAIDEVHCFIAPKLIGGGRALTPFGGLGVSKMDEALKLDRYSVERIGADVLIHGWIDPV
jgi:diaminohydroxyphosphoribosylaminopyrimidine deaminase / 5-amino-6-(5-phosphoribosylamino)uracil reductase